MATQQGNAEIMTDLCPTITQAAGKSGNNQPVLCKTVETKTGGGSYMTSTSMEATEPESQAALSGSEGIPRSSYMKIVGALCARDSKGIGNQYVTEGKLIIDNRK